MGEDDDDASSAAHRSSYLTHRFARDFSFFALSSAFFSARRSARLASRSSSSASHRAHFSCSARSASARARVLVSHLVLISAVTERSRPTHRVLARDSSTAPAAIFSPMHPFVPGRTSVSSVFHPRASVPRASSLRRRSRTHSRPRPSVHRPPAEHPIRTTARGTTPHPERAIDAS